MLDDDSVAPKMKILEAVGKIENAQRQIAMLDAQAKLMQQRANQFLMGGPDEQSSMMADAVTKMQAQSAAEEELPEEEIPEEIEVMSKEEILELVSTTDSDDINVLIGSESSVKVMCKAVFISEHLFITDNITCECTCLK